MDLEDMGRSGISIIPYSEDELSKNPKEGPFILRSQFFDDKIEMTSVCGFSDFELSE